MTVCVSAVVDLKSGDTGFVFVSRGEYFDVTDVSAVPVPDEKALMGWRKKIAYDRSVDVLTDSAVVLSCAFSDETFSELWFPFLFIDPATSICFGVYTLTGVKPTAHDLTLQST